jgi:hypothetical protein
MIDHLRRLVAASSAVRMVLRFPAANWTRRANHFDLRKSCQAQKFCKSKYFSFHRPKSLRIYRHPVPLRGALAIVTNEGRVRWTLMLRLTVAAEAYGESVWSWRP